MTEQKWNQIPPIQQVPEQTKSAPLAEVIANPGILSNPVPSQPLVYTPRTLENPNGGK
jgi:hypothetical protein